MKLFLSKADRIKYLGFDDHRLIIVLLPFVAGLACLIFVAQKPNADWITYLVCYTIGFYHTAFYWVSNRFWMVQLRRYYPRQDQIRRRIVYVLLLAVCMVLLFEVVSEWVIGAFTPQLSKESILEPSPLFAFVVSLTLNIMVLAVYESIYFFTKYRSSLVEQERLAKANMQAQLVALKQQVNPHFLFNSLNTLANVIPEDPQLATRFVQRLAAVYRRVIDYRHQELVSLNEELTALQDYAFLLETRFEDKLSIEVHYPDEHPAATTIIELKNETGSSDPNLLPYQLGQRKIVPLSLQLLVENAIKHNIISSEQPLLIKLMVAEQRIMVVNNLQLRPHRVNSTGLGQQNIRKRYHLLTEKEVQIESTDREYRISIPLLSDDTILKYATA